MMKLDALDSCTSVLRVEKLKEEKIMDDITNAVVSVTDLNNGDITYYATLQEAFDTPLPMK